MYNADGEDGFQKHCGKDHHHFLLFPRCFLSMHLESKPPIFYSNHILKSSQPESHSSVCSVQDLRTGGRWFDPWLGHYFFRRLMIVIATGFIPLSLTALNCFDNGYLGKQPVTWKEYCAECWLKELQESTDRCTGREVIEIDQLINQKLSS